jgi:hypothetical protein
MSDWDCFFIYTHIQQFGINLQKRNISASLILLSLNPATFCLLAHGIVYDKKVKQSLYTPCRRLGGEEV